MKKLTIFALISIMIAGSVFAQPVREQQREAVPQARSERQREAVPQARGERQREVNPQARGEGQREITRVTVNGTLKLDKGFVAVESGEIVYHVPMLNRFIGFISGLREGTNVSVEGFQFRNMLRPTKLTIDGRTYDFPRETSMQNTRFGFGSDNRNMGNDRHFNNQRQNRHNYGHNRHNAPNHRNKNNSCGCCR